ncbi:MAG: hypothetical protein LBR89_01100 [Holosporales bacterium]|jgi:hypothetical protein|nr:hypothetical protein [Holosporales bacterium]
MSTILFGISRCAVFLFFVLSGVTLQASSSLSETGATKYSYKKAVCLVVQLGRNEPVKRSSIDFALRFVDTKKLCLQAYGAPLVFENDCCSIKSSPDATVELTSFIDSCDDIFKENTGDDEKFKNERVAVHSLMLQVWWIWQHQRPYNFFIFG